MIGWLAAAWAAPASERSFVLTEDGATVAVHRTANPGKEPVVLVHGISSNHLFWDLGPGRSLATTLWDAGYDVWNVDLRGHGDAERNADGTRLRTFPCVDDYGRYDLPAVFRAVSEATGQVPHYVGHSMGGMVLAIALATTEVRPRSAVVVGSPLDFRDPDGLVAAFVKVSAFGQRWATPAGARFLAVLRRNTVGKLDELLENPENLSPDAEVRMLRRGVSPLYLGEIAQFAASREDGEFRSTDGTVLYRERLEQIAVPMLFVAGRLDRIAPPDRVWSYFDAVGTEDKRFVVASVANGMHADYGHLDLGVGDHVEADVFPLIVDWIRTHP